MMPRRTVLWTVLVGSLAFWPRAAAADLMTLYARALESDPVLQTARLQIQVAESGVREARSGALPQINASLQSSEATQDILDSGDPLFTEGRTDFSSTDFSVSLTQPLYRADVGAEVRGARIGVRQRAVELDATRQELVFRLARTFFDVLAARDDLELASAERTAIGRQLAESEERLAAGLGTPTTVHEARARLSLARAAEIEARDDLESARHALTEIVGFLPLEIGALSEAFPLESPEPDDVAAWIESALFRNPRVRALQLQLEVIDAELRRAKAAARRPSLDLVGSYSNSDTGATEFGGGREVANTNVGLRLSLPVWDGGRSTAVARGSVLQRRQVIAQIELNRRQLEREVRDAFRIVGSSVGRVAALRQSTFSQEAVLSQRQEALRAGLTTQIELLDATRELFAARRDLARARYLFILNDLRLKQAAGILGESDLRRIDAYLQ